MGSGVPLVSIIVACRDARADLAPGLRGLARQGYDAIEVIVVDHGSSDGSAAEAERAAASLGLPARVLAAPGPPGPPGPNFARRAGLAAATGAYVSFFDAGDIAGRGQLGAAVARLEAEAGLDLAYHDWEVWSEREGRGPAFELWPALAHVDLRREALAGVPYPLSSLTLRRATAERLVDLGGLEAETPAGSARAALLVLGAMGAEAGRVEAEPVRVRSRADAFASRRGRERERAEALGLALRRFARLSEARGVALSPFERSIVEAPAGPHRLGDRAVIWSDWSFGVTAARPLDPVAPLRVGGAASPVTPLSSLAGSVALKLQGRADALRGRGLDEIRREVWRAFGWRREAFEPLALALDELRAAGFVTPCEGP